MKKAQLSIYLDREIFASLEAYATRQGKPKSLVAEAAIASFFLLTIPIGGRLRSPSGWTASCECSNGWNAMTASRSRR
jgi:hypothetical protein